MKRTEMTVYWFAVCFILLKGVYSGLVEKPPGTLAILEGASVVLNCASNVSSGVFMQWFNNTSCVQDITCPSSDIIYNGFVVTSPNPAVQVLTNNTAGRYARNLYFSTTTVSDGNNYVCAEYANSASTTDQAVTKLVVVGGLPQCHVQSSTLYCTIQYKGPVTPAVQFNDANSGTAFQGNLKAPNSTTDASSTSTTFVFESTQTGTANCTVSFNQYTFTQQCPPITALPTTTPLPPYYERPSFYSWPWVQALIVIATVGTVSAICTIILAVYFHISTGIACADGCGRYSTIALVAISMLMALGTWIGSAVSLSQFNGSNSTSDWPIRQYIEDQNRGWLIGALVIGLVEMALDIAVLTFNIYSKIRDIGIEHFGFAQVCLSVARFFLFAAVLAWTITVGEKYKENSSVDYSLTSYWTWQIFLITGTIAAIVAAVIFVVLWFCRDRCCNTVCPKICP